MMLPVAASLHMSGPEVRRARLLAGYRSRFLLSLALAALCLGIVLSTGASLASTPDELPPSPQAGICGPISIDETWSVGQSPVRVTCDAQVLPGVILDIDPGVEIQFSAGVSLTISGTLRAAGLSSQPITFTSGLEVKAPGDWDGLHFVAGSSESSLGWCVVEYATVGLRVFAGPGETVSPAFSNSLVRRNSGHGFELEGYASGCDEAQAQPTITGCTVEHNGGSGIYGYGHGDEYDGCAPDPATGGIGGAVSGSIVRDNQGPGIYMLSDLERYSLGDVWIKIAANVISGNAGHGMHLDGDGLLQPRTENNLVYGNAGAGIQSDAYHHSTGLYVVNNSIHDNKGHGLTFNKSALQVRLTNNIVSANGGYGLVCLTEGPLSSHNDLWLNAAGDYDGCAPGLTDIAADPLLLDPAAGDFRPAFGSPCIDAGTSTDAPETDIEGIVRPKGSAVDIGAHEQGHWELYLPVALRQ